MAHTGSCYSVTHHRFMTLNIRNPVQLWQEPACVRWSASDHLVFIFKKNLMARTSNIKARYSRKYLREGQGVSAYNILVNHIPLISLSGYNFSTKW